MPDKETNVLIRAYTMDLRRNHGNVVVAEMLRRRVDFHPNPHRAETRNTPGAVLIDSSDALGAIGGAINREIGFLLLIRSTDELLWLPTRADMMAGDYWTIEVVPWLEHVRAASLPDAEIIRRAHLESEPE